MGLTLENEKLNVDRKLVIKKLKKERSNTEEKVENFKKESDQYRSRIQTLEPLIERLSYKVDELASDRSKLVERINDLENENLKLNKDLSTVAFASKTTTNHGPIQGPSENTHKLTTLRKKEYRQSKELTNTQNELSTLMQDLKRKEQENAIYFTTITDLQNTKINLQNKINNLQKKDKSHLDTLSKMTYKADEIAKDAQQFAIDEKKRSSGIQLKYQAVVGKLRDADLEIERLRREVAVNNAIKSLEYWIFKLFFSEFLVKKKNLAQVK